MAIFIYFMKTMANIYRVIMNALSVRDLRTIASRRRVPLKSRALKVEIIAKLRSSVPLEQLRIDSRAIAAAKRRACRKTDERR